MNMSNSMQDVQHNNIIEKKCGYCAKIIIDDNYLNCQKCNKQVHIKCLERGSTPGDLLGDVFFDLICANCTGPNISSAKPKEELVRQHIPWLLVIAITLYNLNLNSKGLSHKGYFHWRTHIISFINKNWDYFFISGTRRRKNWLGSISGSLSHNSPHYFLSGHNELNEGGWWKLTYDKLTPRAFYKKYNETNLQRQLQRQEGKTTQIKIHDVKSDETESNSSSSDKEEAAACDNKLCSRLIPYMGCDQRSPNKASDAATRELNANSKPNVSSMQTNLLDFLAESLFHDNDTSLYNSFEANDLAMSVNHSSLLKNSLLWDTESELCIDAQNDDDKFSFSNSSVSVKDSDDDDSVAHMRILKVTNFQNCKQETNEPNFKEMQIKTEPFWHTDGSDTDDSDIAELTVQPSLFTRKYCRPWNSLIQKTQPAQAQEEDEDLKTMKNTLNWKNRLFIDECEENKLLEKLEKYFDAEHKNVDIKIPAFIRRIYHKLRLRAWKRDNHRKIFNLDDELDPYIREMKHISKELYSNHILNRYLLASNTTSSMGDSFHMRIIGNSPHEFFQSPYTHLVLQPFIYRNKDCVPTWLRLMNEIIYKVHNTIPSHSCIDYCYLRPYHIGAVNALLQTLFWPGIDMSECLVYPDYTIVALYKKLVIGCAFLVPDVNLNEAYISFLAVRPGWQRAGIATFMIYHLLQACPYKDITLHVSATNTAVMLYQKFGFKIEEICLNFYDKYMPLERLHSRHALFLRLTR